MVHVQSHARQRQDLSTMTIFATTGSTSRPLQNGQCRWPQHSLTES
jgi:hypothetical protein